MRDISCKYLAVTAVLATAGFTSLAMGQVANDECTGATVLTEGVAAPCNTTTATPSADPVPSDATCAATYLAWGTANPDVWYRYNATQNGLVDISTCFVGGFDTSIVLYSGACGALTQVACNGDALADPSCQQYHSKITGAAVSAGSTYYLRVGGYQGAVGVAQVLLTFTPAGTGCPASGGCGVVHATPGCEDAACCTAVCAVNPLCCDVGWDQNCVDAAVGACGIFVYQCAAPSATVPNDCAINAIAVNTDQTFTQINSTNCNTDGPNHSGATCNSGNDFFYNDFWYRVQVAANGDLTVRTCGTASYDTKLAIYNMGANPAAFDYNTLNAAGVLVGCNDDGAGGACYLTDGTTPYASALTVPVNSGNYYLVRVASYLLPTEAGAPPVFTTDVVIDLPEPCALPPQTGFEAEACGSASNNGCNGTGQSEDIVLGSRIRGSFFTATDPANPANQIRDTDFYKLTITQDALVTVRVSSATFVQALILGGDIAVAGCGAVSILGSGSGNCPTTATACLNPGTYYVFVAPAGGFANNPCGSGVANEYVVEVTSAPAQCPDLIDQACAAPGVNTYNSASYVPPAPPTTLAAGLVACAANGAFPNCATGGTTPNSWARPMPLGAVGGSITCLDFGAFSVRRGTNAAGTACASFFSDVPLPATIGIYADINGGTPTNKIVTPGDGGDLQLIEERFVLIPGGLFVYNIDFDPPLCLQGVPANANIVVVMDAGDFIGGVPGVTANSGYNMRPGGGTVAGTQSGTYGRLGPNGVCGTLNTPAYALLDTLGTTFTAQWVVNFRGDFSNCPTACTTDLNGDGVTGSADLSVLLNAWGGTSPDLNGDGVVGSADLSVMLNAWGACP